jgi:hypothetical protein
MSDLLPQVQEATTLAARQAKAEALFPELEWLDEITAYCPCPGQHKHTTPKGDRDCRVKIDGVATVSCVHASCEEEIKAANRALRIGIQSSTPLVSTTKQKKLAAAAKTKAAREELIRVRTKKSLPRLLKTYAWPYDKIVADSPNPVPPDDRQKMIEAFMGMFAADDVIWVGDVSSTGKSHHVANFKTKAQWLAGEIPAGPYTCPSCFAPGAYSRSKENVALQRYLVVESDTLKKDEVGAIFRWLDQAVELPLRAVVDTAGKSLHGWLEFPPPDVLAELKIMLPVMGCDPKMFGSSQPCRLPGGLRDGRIQKLIYSKNGGVK